MPAVKSTIRTHERAVELGRRRHSLDVYIKSIVDRAPELTDEQRNRLAAILRGRSPEAGAQI
jgi:hypothetical protein